MLNIFLVIAKFKILLFSCKCKYFANLSNNPVNLTVINIRICSFTEHAITILQLQDNASRALFAD